MTRNNCYVTFSHEILVLFEQIVLIIKLLVDILRHDSFWVGYIFDRSIDNLKNYDCSYESYGKDQIWNISLLQLFKIISSVVDCFDTPFILTLNDQCERTILTILCVSEDE